MLKLLSLTLTVLSITALSQRNKSRARRILSGPSSPQFLPRSNSFAGELEPKSDVQFEQFGDCDHLPRAYSWPSELPSNFQEPQMEQPQSPSTPSRASEEKFVASSQPQQQTEARELELIEGFKVYLAAIEQMNEGTHIDVIKKYFQECRSRVLKDAKISTMFNKLCLRELIVRAVQRETGQNGPELHDLFIFTSRRRQNKDMRKKLHARADVVERALKLQ